MQVLNFAEGQKPIIQKLPNPIINRWRRFGKRHEEEHSSQYPLFAVFVEFLNVVVQEHCDENYDFSTTSCKLDADKSVTTISKSARTLITTADKTQSPCPIHPSANHPLSSCRAFTKLSLEERRETARTSAVCYNCLGFHKRAKCQVKHKCTTCNRPDHHPTLCAKEIKSSMSASSQQNLFKPVSTKQHGNEKSPTDGNSMPKPATEQGPEKSATIFAPRSAIMLRAKAAARLCWWSSVLLISP